MLATFFVSQFDSKMKKTLYFLWICFPLTLWSLNVSKEVEQQFLKEGISSLTIANSYGNIMFLPSTNDSVMVKASIVADVIEMADTNEVFRYIDPQMSTNKNTLEIKTIYNSDLNNATLAGVHYTIYVPDSINLTITNRYGNISLFDIYGSKDIALDYGKLHCENLYMAENTKNNIALTFASLKGKKADSLDLQLNNSTVELLNIRGCAIKSSYSVVQVKEMGSLNANSDNDRYDIGAVKNLSLKATNTIATINELVKKLEVDFSKGSLAVNSIASEFSGLNVSLQNTNAILSISPKTNYVLNAVVQYGNFTYPAYLSMEIIEDLDKTIYKGISNQQEPNSQVGIIGYNSTIKIK